MMPRKTDKQLRIEELRKKYPAIGSLLELNKQGETLRRTSMKDRKQFNGRIKRTFTIIGDPVPQKRHRMGRGFSYDPSAKDKKIVKLQLKAQQKKKVIHNGRVSMYITFYMKRPKSHYRTGKFKNILKKDAPFNYTNKPDIDNLVKFILDCCNGIIYKDDSQVNHLSASKIYSPENKSPKTKFDIIHNEGE